MCSCVRPRPGGMKSKPMRLSAGGVRRKVKARGPSGYMDLADSPTFKFETARTEREKAHKNQ